MITIDFECANGHRFEGNFSDYESFSSQQDADMIACPLCSTTDVKRIYTGCSIRPRQSAPVKTEQKSPGIFEAIRSINRYVRENFENVGRDFPDAARAMHYGIEEERQIYGESTPQEISELVEEGISLLPLVDIDGIEN